MINIFSHAFVDTSSVWDRLGMTTEEEINPKFLSSWGKLCYKHLKSFNKYIDFKTCHAHMFLRDIRDSKIPGAEGP